MTIKTHKIFFKTQKQFQAVDISEEVTAVVATSNVEEGLVTVYAPHTTAAIRLTHNEPLLIQDLMNMLYRIAPLDLKYSHDLFEIRSKVAPDERSNGHAHVKSFLLGSSQSIPVLSGKMQTGERQSIFFVELDGPRDRGVVIQIMGE